MIPVTGMSSHFLNRLAVCSWSLQPKSPEELIDYMGQIGLKTVQIALDPIRENPDVWGKTKELCQEKGIIFVSGMFGTIGEDYTTMESIKRTGGVVPDETWTQNWQNIQQIADLAKTGAEDMYDHLAWMDGRRVAVPNDEPVAVRHEGEQRDGYVVVDRRVRV